MSKSVELAEALTALLNDKDQAVGVLGGDGYSMPFEAKRRAAPFTVTELEELKVVQVAVYTGAQSRERQTRGKYRHTYKPIISIQQYADGRSEADVLTKVDALEGLVEEIYTVLEKSDLDLAGLSFLAFDDEEDREAYNADALKTLKVFVTDIELEYTDG